MDKVLTQKALKIGNLLVNQEAAKVIVPAMAPAPGYWFGGGNVAVDQNGEFWVCGRYRNAGDSRFGITVGERGAELAIFKGGQELSKLEKAVSFKKSELDAGDRQVLSIEGCKLHFTENGVELFVSSEKKMDYPTSVSEFQKPGTGVWTIEHAFAPTVEDLKNARLKTILEGTSPEVLHVKDPVIYDTANSDTILAFCTHPFSWASSNSGYTIRRNGETKFEQPNFTFFPRGFAWDVGISRVTGILPLPRKGPFSNRRYALFFYDGGECMRNLDEHEKAVKRPRGYSCEELGGLALITDDELNTVERISSLRPAFISPFYNTGCSRYVDILETESHYYSTWQQSQSDGSQPLVLNLVERKTVEKALEV